MICISSNKRISLAVLNSAMNFHDIAAEVFSTRYSRVRPPFSENGVILNKEALEMEPLLLIERRTGRGLNGQGKYVKQSSKQPGDV